MNLDDLTLFTRIADTGSITAAADQLDMTPATASAALKRLESAVGTQLFIRSTRQLRITTEGETFLIHAHKALDAIQQGVSSLHSSKGEVQGRIRISLSSDLGRNQVLPWLENMMEQHPKLSIRLSMQDENIDFYSNHVDVALRYGAPEDSSMIGFHIATLDRVICASPEYIKNYGEPKHPQDLKSHNCLLYSIANRVFDTWKISNQKASYKIRVQGNRICNDGDVVRRWLVNGKGIAFKSRLDLTNDLAANRVVEILPDFKSSELELWLICPSRQQVTPAVLLLRDMFRERIANALGSP